jgi:hypothetical protein
MPVIGSTSSQSGRLPGVPTEISAYFSNQAYANVIFTEPAYTGKGEISYTVTSSPAGLSGITSSGSAGLGQGTPGTAYTFTVTASSSGVASATSSPTASIVMPPYFTAGSVNVSASSMYGALLSFEAVGAARYELVALDSVPPNWFVAITNTGPGSTSVYYDPSEGENSDGPFRFRVRAWTAGDTASALSGLGTFGF